MASANVTILGQSLNVGERNRLFVSEQTDTVEGEMVTISVLNEMPRAKGGTDNTRAFVDLNLIKARELRDALNVFLGE